MMERSRKSSVLNNLPQTMKTSIFWTLAAAIIMASNVEGQRCDGTETFEKVSNVILRSAVQIPLYSSAGNTVTAECNNRCRSSNSCPAFLVNYETETCFRLDANSEGRREDLIAAPLKVNYFEKICLQAPSCDRAWMFERVVGYELKGFDDMVINEVPTKTKCEELCIREKGLKCRSAEYDFVLRQCRLSREDRRTQPAYFQPSTSGNVDYLENQCEGHPPTYNCDYDAIEGKDLGRGDLQVTSPTVDECRLMCDETTVFNCRSFTYFSESKLCHLSGDDIISTNVVKNNALIAVADATFYQKSPCLDLALTCTADSMTVHLNTGEPFEGRIYSQEHPTDPCEIFGSGARKTEISFPLRNSGCGVAEEDKGVFTNVIVVQHHPVIQRRGDKAVKLFCLFETSNKTVTSSLALSSEASQGAVATAIVNATAPSPSIRLRITDAEGRDIVGAKLGERIYLRVEIDDDSIFGIFARNLVARSGSKSDSFTLLDERGCPTDPVIFPSLEKIGPNSKSLVAPFEAFKFTADSVVRFQVNIQFCLPECLPARCGPVESYGKRRRRRSNLLPPAGRSANPRLMDDYMDDEERMYMNKLDADDHDILFHETPLQKEIIIDSSAVVSPFDPDSDRQISSTATGELVCTTKSVVVASILSTAILQVCIVIVCLLCIQVHRKKTKDISHPAFTISPPRSHSIPVSTSGLEINYGSSTGRACGYSTSRRSRETMCSSGRE